jgi:hypothetical protein
MALEASAWKWNQTRNSWHASICKNGVHYWAAEDGCHVLINLDGDRLIGADLPSHVVNTFGDRSGPENMVVHYSNTNDTGTYGATAINRTLFQYMRGYNELFLPCGMQDTELITRAKAAGAKYVHCKDSRIVGCCVPNDPSGDWAMQSKFKTLL